MHYAHTRTIVHFLLQYYCPNRVWSLEIQTTQSINAMDAFILHSVVFGTSDSIDFFCSSVE